VATRDAATPAATTATGAASSGHSSATPVAKAAAEAECPEGNDVVIGGRRRPRCFGTRWTGGLGRRTARLLTTFAAKLARPRPTIPRRAARRARRLPVAASAPLIAHHRTPWSADRPSAGNTRLQSFASLLVNRRNTARSAAASFRLIPEAYGTGAGRDLLRRVTLRKVPVLVLGVVALAALIAVPSLLSTSGRPSGPCDTAAACEGWRLSDSEDFTGSGLDPARWTAYDGYHRASDETWRSAKCSVSGGVLRLDAGSDGLCGVTSRTQETYAKVEVRARFSAPAGAGLAPVFLFWPQNDALWPAAGEIDWLECYDTSRRSFGSWLHYGEGAGNTQDAENYGGDFRVDMSQWHNYAVDWSATQVRVFVDGRLWHTYLSHIPQGPMHLVFQIDRIGAVSGTASVELDWVRHYR
jgi:licheninase